MTPHQFRKNGTAGKPGLGTPSAQGSAPLTCELCGGKVQELKCKIRCTNCGYTRDCSDP